MWHAASFRGDNRIREMWHTDSVAPLQWLRKWRVENMRRSWYQLTQRKNCRSPHLSFSSITLACMLRAGFCTSYPGTKIVQEREGERGEKGVQGWDKERSTSSNLVHYLCQFGPFFFNQKVKQNRQTNGPTLESQLLRTEFSHLFLLRGRGTLLWGQCCFVFAREEKKWFTWRVKEAIFSFVGHWRKRLISHAPPTILPPQKLSQLSTPNST